MLNVECWMPNVKRQKSNVECQMLNFWQESSWHWQNNNNQDYVLRTRTRGTPPLLLLWTTMMLRWLFYYLQFDFLTWHISVAISGLDKCFRLLMHWWNTHSLTWTKGPFWWNYSCIGLMTIWRRTSSQAPSYASPKLSLTDSLTGVKCRATSVAKKA